MSKPLESMSKKELIGKFNTLLSRTDGWKNFFTGVGIQNKDKKTGGYFEQHTRLQEPSLTALYVNDGMSKRIVDVVVEDMVRGKYKVSNDEEDLLTKAAKELDFMENVSDALTWQDVYGGSLLLMGINDGGDFEEKLNEGNIKKIEFLKVYDRFQIDINSSDLYEDPKEAKMGQPKTYHIQPSGGSIPFDVHESRILRFDGVLLPESEKIINNYWNDSVYQAFYERLKGLGNVYGNVETIIEEFIIGVMSIENLENLIQHGAGEDMLKRLSYIDMSKHIINSILIDKEEKFERISATVSGLDGLITKLESGLSAITGIPVTRLFGQSPKGLSASGQEIGQIKIYYDMIAAKREKKMLKQIERFNYLLMLSKEGPTNGKVEEDWLVEFPPLWQPTEEEVVKTRKAQAETDKIYWEIGSLYPGEIAKSRFSGVTYSLDTKLSESHEALIDSEEKEINEAAKNGVFTIGNKNETPEDEIDDNQNKKKEGEE